MPTIRRIIYPQGGKPGLQLLGYLHACLGLDVGHNVTTMTVQFVSVMLRASKQLCPPIWDPQHRCNVAKTCYLGQARNTLFRAEETPQAVVASACIVYFFLQSLSCQVGHRLDYSGILAYGYHFHSIKWSIVPLHCRALFLVLSMLLDGLLIEQPQQFTLNLPSHYSLLHLFHAPL